MARSESRREWSKRASCAGMPGFDAPKTNKEKEKYRTICLDCPVLDLCLEYSLAYKDEEGFWAGLTKADRSRIRRELPASALSLVALESHSSFEFAQAQSNQNPEVKRQLPHVDLELYNLLT